MRTRHDSSAWRLRLLLTALGWCLMLQVGVAQGPIIVNGRPALLGAPVETAAPRPTVLEFS
ncbi:MAG: hypothetical protein HY289_06820, partial [Planctomycetes bacterium]|nr:hypothetical protein [Planctomycetota bacterium]